MRFFLIVCSVFIALASCTQKSQELSEGNMVHLTFNKRSESALAELPKASLEYSKGIEGKGISLENTEDKILISGADPSWFSHQKDFSVSVWVKASDMSEDTTMIFSNADFRKQPMGIYGARRINKGISLYSCNGAWGWNVGNGNLHYNYEPLTEDQSISDKQWHQLAFSYSSQEQKVRLYYDGINRAVLCIGDLKDSDFNSENPLWIGANGDVSPGYSSFKGCIDELKIWDLTIDPGILKKEVESYTGKKIVEPELKSDILTLVNWNIWHGGTHYTLEEDGFDGIERTIELIRESGADIVLMQETYGAGSRISSALGFYYCEASSTIGAVWGANISLMSRFPIEEAFLIEEVSNYGKNYAFNNGGAKIRLSGERSVIAFSNWYNSRKWEDLDGALKAWKDLISNADEVPLIFGGDYNSISHLDDGVGESGHSKLMTGAGFMDVWRGLYPDPETHPGYSFHNTERRIDYIYVKGSKLEEVEMLPIVPDFKGKGELTPGYPSDHLGLVARFKVL
jgi:exonuclease III